MGDTALGYYHYCAGIPCGGYCVEDTMWECFVGDAMWGMLCGGYYEVGYFVVGYYKVGILCGGNTMWRIPCRDTMW